MEEERKLLVFEKRVLRKIFGPERDEVRGELRRLHNEELCSLYASSDIFRVINSRRMRLSGQVARVGERTGTCRVLVREPERKRSPAIPRPRCNNTTEWVLRKSAERSWNGLI